MMTVWTTFKMCNFEPSQSGGPHLESPLPATAVESLIQSVPELPTVRQFRPKVPAMVCPLPPAPKSPFSGAAQG